MTPMLKIDPAGNKPSLTDLPDKGWSSLLQGAEFLWASKL